MKVMYGMILINPFNKHSLAAILVRHLGFQTHIFWLWCRAYVKYNMYHIKPNTSENYQNESFRMINGQIIRQLNFSHSQILVNYLYVIKHSWNYN